MKTVAELGVFSKESQTKDGKVVQYVNFMN